MVLWMLKQHVVNYWRLVGPGSAPCCCTGICRISKLCQKQIGVVEYVPGGGGFTGLLQSAPNYPARFLDQA